MGRTFMRRILKRVLLGDDGQNAEKRTGVIKEDMKLIVF